MLPQVDSSLLITFACVIRVGDKRQSMVTDVWCLYVIQYVKMAEHAMKIINATVLITGLEINAKHVKKVGEEMRVTGKLI